MIKDRVARELIYLIKTALIFAGMLGITIVLSHVLGGALAAKELEMLENEQVLATAMLELIGMQMLQQFPANIEVFFLIIMVLNLIVMGTIIGHSVHAMRKSVEQGAFGFLYMQTMHTGMYFGITVLLVLMTALLTWGIYSAELFLASNFLLKGYGAAVFSSVYAILTSIAGLGAGVVVLMVSISVLYGVAQSYSMHGVDFGLAIMGLSFVLGNVYKIPQVIGHNQIEQMINAQQTMEVARMLKQIRFLCPFSWLNPFNIYNYILSPRMIGSYVIVAVAIFVIAGVVFCLRDWQEV